MNPAKVWRERCEALERLLSYYRIGGHPSERLHRELERTRKNVERLKAADKASDARGES